MHNNSRSTNRRSAAARLVLKLARELHRAATGDSLAASLPVLRRILATRTIEDLSLPVLHRQRARVKRKHLLRTLASEAGYASWEAYRHALEVIRPGELPHFELAREPAGYPNLWFASHAEAEAHAQQHGGRALRVGRQGVVLEAP